MEGTKTSDIESENEVLDAEHSKLLSAVRQLDGKQRVKAPTRKETSRQISEFNLGKHQVENDTVGINELTRALEKRASHVEIGQKLKTLKQKAKPLKPPLEKFEAEKIKRVVGFTNVKNQLSRWNAVVDRNRVADNLTYPLIPKGLITLDTTKDFIKRFESQSELEAKMAEILSRSKVVKGEKETEKKAEEEEEFPLTLEEIMERRKEMAKLRAQQSYREAKAARQKKIKSKSYHRTLRHQKIKQQLKDFENLQKTDPEAALKQLEQIERARAEERMTLRHRNTGKWARSRAVRAKYNEQTRQELAEQLAISRDLTKKIQIEESSSDEAVEEDTKVNSTSNTDNPWVNGKTESEVENFLRGYRRYWEQKNATEQQQEDKNKPSQKTIESNNGLSGSEENEIPIQDKNQGTIRGSASETVMKEISAEHSSILEEENKEPQDKKNTKEVVVNIEKVKRKKQSPVKEKKKRKIEVKDDKTSSLDFISTSSSWQVTTVRTNDDLGMSKAKQRGTEPVDSKKEDSSTDTINRAGSGESVEELFQKMEDKMRASVNKRIEKYQKELLLNVSEGVNVNGDDSGDETQVSLEMRKQLKRPEVDEALSEGADKQNSSLDVSELQKLSGAISGGQQINQRKPDIDPNKFIAVKAKPLDSELPDVADMEEALDDDADESARQLTIAEAFADDDVVEQFRKEKEEAVKKSEPEDLDLSLPGWGTWGGKGILVSVPKKKKKRFIIKFPKPPPRKDSNKGDVIINEDKDVKIKEHQVNELPFPFTTVKDFEASVRAPIGATWVTQSAHRKLTVPKYKTYLGKIIKPIDEDLLLKKKPVTKKQ